MYTRTQRTARAIAAFVFIAAGIVHFLMPATLARFIPPYLPAAALLVLISGVSEIAGGVGLLLPRFRRWAAWGLSAMLTAFLPANLFMAAHPAEAGFASVPAPIFWARLPLLPVMIWCLFWCTRQNKQPR